MKLHADLLIEGCSDESFDSGITIKSTLESLTGANAPIKPATYEGGQYQKDKRWIDSHDKPVDVLVIDNVPSQANRLEAALEKLASSVGLPEMVLDLTAHPHLPPHIPPRMSSFRFPHRNADSYARDAELDGQPLSKTDIGNALFTATPWNAAGLLEWMPHALLFGFWQSHLGKKGPQTKLARCWTSEIVGYEPATTETKRLGLKGDPLNLTLGEGTVKTEKDSHMVWEVLEKGKGAKLSEIGHGQVPVGGNDAPAGAVSFRTVEQKATLSFAGLRNISMGEPEQNALARALVASIGVLAHVAAFGRGFSLRSGADLRTTNSVWTWLGASSDELLEIPTIEEATATFADLVTRSEAAGLPVSGWSAEPVELQPNGSLLKVLASTYPEFSL